MIWFVHLIRRRPMVSFAVLACLLGWSNYIEVWFGLGSDPSNMPLGPVIAALLVTACQGRDALKIWGRRLVGWRAAPTLYAVAVLLRSWSTWSSSGSTTCSARQCRPWNSWPPGRTSRSHSWP